MATTDSRTGFRLPWSTDRAASREASADPAEPPVAAATTFDAGATTPADPGETSNRDAAGDAIRGQEDGPVTILAPDTAQHPAPTDVPSTASAPAPPDTAPSAPAAPPAARKPTKFLADLTRAMQAAAEQARSSTLDQFRAEGTGVIEQIHARSAGGATELRRRADDDVAAIKEWSKAEIARIREETEHRIGARREQLEGQLERHAALIEHEIEKVRGRITDFESEMGHFFDELVHEEDPAVFAARAASLPEPPTFEDLDDDALASLLREPGVGVPEAEADVDKVAPAEATVPGLDETAAAPAVAAGDTAGEAAPADPEAAMAAIQAAAEAAATVEGGPAAVEAKADAPEAEAPPEVTAEMSAEGAAEVTAEMQAEATGEMQAEAPASFAADVPEGAPEVDPRLAMLGLTPDFEAAEVAAAEAAAAEVDDVPEIGGDALAARLSGLVPGDAPAEASTTTVTTQIVVTGLVSVASIASFKRHLGRLAGVAHVGVSSGPDGEFVFAVEHDPEASLRDLVPTLPGFAARVVSSGDGFVQVSAQDPQD